MSLPPNKYLNYLPTKTQNKNYSYFPIFGHTFLCPFFKSATTFFSEKTQKTTSEHNAAKRDFPRFYLLLNFFLYFLKKDLGVFYVSIIYLQMVDIKTPKNAKKYICEACDFKCSKLSDYNRHVLTAKHEILTNTYINTYNYPQKNAKAYSCECGKEYKHRQSLNNHKQICQKNSKKLQENTFVPEKEKEEEPSEKQLMLTIIKQMAEIMPRIGDTNNSHNTNCNNTFNVQMYLNNECKNAMSIQDFIKSIELNMSHLNAITDKGYVDSVSNIMIKALSDLEITDRPLHCTDLKRDTIYIKDHDEWNKSSAKDETLMSGVITDIENKHYGLVKQYARENPQAAVMDTPENKYQNKALQNALGNSVDSEVLQKKIYKEVLPKVKLDKSCI